MPAPEGTLRVYDSTGGELGREQEEEWLNEQAMVVASLILRGALV